MGESKISWTQKTWNPTTGCTKLGKECENCYAEKDTNRKKFNSQLPNYKDGFDVFREHENTLGKPLKFKSPEVVFVDSMSDLFHDDATLPFIKMVFKVMNETPQHTYQVLTKRAKNVLKYTNELTWTDNIWMGVTVGINATKHRIADLQKCGAKHKFVSIEPLLEQIDEMDLSDIGLVIVGGESGGNKARPFEKEWVVKMKEICDSQNVPFFFKQWGKLRNNPDQNDPTQHKKHRFHGKGGCMLNGQIYQNNPCMPNYLVEKVNLFGADFLVMDEYEDLITIWDLKSYLPAMEDDQFKNLKEDIKKNGVIDPILYFKTCDDKKIVIEGHTRLNAAMELSSRTIPSKEINKAFSSLDEMKMWMVEHQCQRRNLSNVDKLKIAYSSIELIKKKAESNLSKAGKGKSIDQEVHTHAELAKIASVSDSTAQRYIFVVESGSEAIKTKMHKGQITISGAEKSVRTLVTTTDKYKNKRSKAKVIPEVMQFNSYENGIEALHTNKIKSLVIIKDNSKLELFSLKQKKDIGFLISGD